MFHRLSLSAAIIAYVSVCLITSENFVVSFSRLAITTKRANHNSNNVKFQLEMSARPSSDAQGSFSPKPFQTPGSLSSSSLSSSSPTVQDVMEFDSSPLGIDAYLPYEDTETELLTDIRENLEVITPPYEAFNSIDLPIPSTADSAALRRGMSNIFDLNDPSSSLGRLLVIAAAAIYGTNFATVKVLNDSMPMEISAALRFALGAAVVSAYVFGKEEKPSSAMEQEDRKGSLLGGMEIGFWYTIGYLAQAKGLETIGAGKIAFFCALAVVVVPVLDVLLKGKHLEPTKMASLAVACIGVALMELGPGGSFSISPGDITGLVQSLGFGIGYWRLESISQKYPSQAGRITVGQLVAVASGAVAYAAVMASGSDVGFALPTLHTFVGWLKDPFIVSALCWTGIGSTAFALYLETVALKVLSAAEVTLLMTTLSLWAAGFAFFMIGEVPTTSGMAGGLMILLGCFLGNVKELTGSPEATTDDVVTEGEAFKI